MRGYKGTDVEMKCRGFKFELGKTYHIDGDIELCKNGFHFCQKLKDVFDFYENDNGNRFFEVKACGQCKTDGNKYVTSKIKFVREIGKLEINRNMYGFGNGFGNGYGDGFGYSDGNGFGNGYSDGFGYSDGNGYGDGFGYSDGFGFGNGYGDGFGYSDGNGFGNGFGNGYGRGFGNGNIQRILIFKD